MDDFNEKSSENAWILRLSLKRKLRVVRRVE
jgi:hypothetical protein